MLQWIRGMFSSPNVPQQSEDNGSKEDDTVTLQLKRCAEQAVRESSRRKITLMNTSQSLRSVAAESIPPK